MSNICVVFSVSLLRLPGSVSFLLIIFRLIPSGCVSQLSRLWSSERDAGGLESSTLAPFAGGVASEQLAAVDGRM